MSLPTAWVEPESRTRTYRIWCGMNSRCRNPNAKDYPAYGGRGIKVCDRWRVYANFLHDMGKAPDGMSLDRINGDGNYEQGNCRWATRELQNRNQRDINLYEFGGTLQCLAGWAKDTGISWTTLKARLNRGWDFPKAVTTPVRAHKPYERSAP